MNESTVSSAFMKQLREAVPGALVFKHRDASMIGLPDCSVTYNQKAFWFEFKLFPMKKKWIDWRTYFVIVECMIEATKKAPAQRELMNRLAAQCPAYYIIWLKKTCVVFVHPLTLSITSFETTAQAVAFIAELLKA